MAVLDTFSLAGKVSVVTGANRGIGRALALTLAEAGSDVVLLVRNPESAAPVLAEITELGAPGRRGRRRRDRGRTRWWAPSARSSSSSVGWTSW